MKYCLQKKEKKTVVIKALRQRIQRWHRRAIRYNGATEVPAKSATQSRVAEVTREFERDGTD